MLLPFHVLQSLDYGELITTNTEDENIEKDETVQGDVEKSEGIKESQQEEALFDPPLYKQRYSAVVDIINKHSAKFVIDMGCSEGQFICKVKDMCPTVEKVIGVDVDIQTLQANSHRLKPLTIEHILKREVPLTLSLYNGSIIKPDLRFRGADVIACIEVIEHLYNEILDNVPHALFGILTPKVVVITTPNCEYNVLFKNFSGMRHYDHKFEWTRKEFEFWCSNIVDKYPYDMEISGVGKPPAEYEVGYCSQMAVFTRHTSEIEQCISETNMDKESTLTTELADINCSKYDLISEVVYPFDDMTINRTQRITNETDYIINHFFADISDETEETFTREILIDDLLLYPGLKKFDISREDFIEIVQSKYSLSPNFKSLLVTFRLSDFMRDSWYSDDSDDFDLDGELSSGITPNDEVNFEEIEDDWD